MRRAATMATLAIVLGTPAATDAQDEPAPAPTVPVHILRDGAQALVVADVRIQGATYRFVVDTGASATLIDSSVARKLKLKRAGKPKPFQGAGCKGSATPVRISGWRLGTQDLPALTVASAKTGLAGGTTRLAGLLGSDVLQTFGKVTVDYKGAQLALGG